MHVERRIRSAEMEDQNRMVALLPELADFDVPASRNPRHLWEGDGELLAKVLAGGAPKTFIDVMEGTAEEPDLVGFVMVTLREELLSHRPSAHLETILVHPKARGRGLGRQLMAHVESKVRELGAESLTLHVFSNNHRARALYSQRGFDSELIRAVKWL